MRMNRNTKRIEDLAPHIGYSAPGHVREVISSLGRTEDVRFSPDNRRLAVAAFRQNRIAIFDISIASAGGSASVALTNVIEFSSRYLDEPHGLDFVSDDRILVTNRSGQVCVFDLPSVAAKCLDLEPISVIRSGDIVSPGSVAVVSGEQGQAEALVCNNYVHTITRHALDAGDGGGNRDGVVLRKMLDIPDGISVSKQQQWVAISNHGTHTILIYEGLSSLNEASAPVGILRHTDYPHGLRFTADDRFIVVADAGSPYLNIYEKDDLGWRGIRRPLLQFRALSNEDFLSGRHNVEEGGVKGIDVNAGGSVLVSTCECQPLVFFDFNAILQRACGADCRPDGAVDGSRLRPLRSRVLDSLAIQYALNLWRLKKAARPARTSIGKFADQLGVGNWLRSIARSA
jgi:hypothetical protein